MFVEFPNQWQDSPLFPRLHGDIFDVTGLQVTDSSADELRANVLGYLSMIL